MKLIYTETGELVKVGDTAKTFRGRSVEVKSFDKPHKPSSSGHVETSAGRFYVGVIGAAWVEREDQA